MTPTTNLAGTDLPPASAPTDNTRPQDSGDRGPVVIVDDDPLFRESLRLNLEDEGYLVYDFADGVTALSFLDVKRDVCVVLLDWKMPQMDGLQVLHRLREDGSDVPVIFLTVLSDEIYEEAALEGGAVDFVEKSRSFSILMKRIALIEAGRKGLDAPSVDEPATVTVGGLTLWPDSKRAAWKDNPVELTVREFDIVAALVERRGHDVSYREIYDTVHGRGFLAGDGSEGLRGTVRTIIKRVRQKFRSIDSGFEEIENFPGFGYRWRREDKS